MQQESSSLPANNNNQSRPSDLQIANAEKDLLQLIERKKQIERNLINLEVQIFNLETAYLEESHHWGNLIRGLDGYLAGRPERKKAVVQDSERVFSNSSATFQKALSIHDRLVGGGGGGKYSDDDEDDDVNEDEDGF